MSAIAIGETTERTYLDALPLIHSRFGYGALGRAGNLGYEGKSVAVAGLPYPHALSTHGPAVLRFQLDGRFQRFVCAVAFNDDVPRGASHCSFTVLADGRQVGTLAHVVAGDAPRRLQAAIDGARQLELIVSTDRWEYCHSVWLDPFVDEMPCGAGNQQISDCLGRVEVSVPAVRPHGKRCIATVVSGAYAALLDDMLGSLHANSGCQDALVVVFSVGDDRECRRIAAKYGATLIACRLTSRLAVNIKSLLYSVARIVDAEAFLCMDADMLVLDDLRPVFAAIEACPASSILACREGNTHFFQNLQHVLTGPYGGQAADIEHLLGTANDEAAYPLVVNDGLFAGSRAALLALDDAISRMRNAAAWVDARREIGYRNQFIFNLALAQLRAGVELDPTYNVQLHVQDAELRWTGGRVEALWNGRSARVLHFSGAGRNKYPAWRGHYAGVAAPLLGDGDGDRYAGFVSALRAWVGRLGIDALTWSFYGISDGSAARVRDPSVFPLFALLHYIVRANGCVRVLETGTAKGVSAACLATAVAGRQGGRVVTFDPAPQAERLELWNALPANAASRIEQRVMGSIEGMSAALAAKEQYEVALLDSIHYEDHVWAEFQLAAQLVCPGGLILIHDARLEGCTVEQALQRIEAAGYGVTRLWTADVGVVEDDKLGLAVIENRRRKMN